MLVALLCSACTGGANAPADQAAAKVLRLGYMANLTHAQALLGAADGSFTRATGVPVAPRIFHAGPAAMTALFAGEIDLLYIGPSPAVNGFVRSQGKAVRVIAGAASGGAVFAVRQGVDPQDLQGSRLASPGVANTQDIALRHYIAAHHWQTREQGGRLQITPLPPVDILGLFRQGELDGAWVPEPWGARLEQEAGAVIAFDERELWPDGRFASTLLVVSPAFMAANREAVKAFLGAHVALTRWIQQHPTEASKRIQATLGSIQGKPLPDAVIEAALMRLEFLYDPMIDSVTEQANRAYMLGLLGARKPELSGLYDLTLLKEVAP
jgi:NitT/TauT family transport system substrate-binding protein